MANETDYILHSYFDIAHHIFYYYIFSSVTATYKKDIFQHMCIYFISGKVGQKNLPNPILFILPGGPIGPGVPGGPGTPNEPMEGGPGGPRDPGLPGIPGSPAQGEEGVAVSLIYWLHTFMHMSL